MSRIKLKEEEFETEVETKLFLIELEHVLNFFYYFVKDNFSINRRIAVFELLYSLNNYVFTLF